MSVPVPVPQTQTKKITLYLDPEFKKKLKTIAALKETTINELSRVALELLLTLIDHGVIPDDLGYLLEKSNPKLLDKLYRLVKGPSNPALIR